MNPVGTRKCGACGKPRPKRRRVQNKLPVHSYEVYLEIEGGSENCFICGRPPGEKNNPNKKNHRDHDHATGMPRGLLCFRHNSLLRGGLTLEVAKRYVLYLKRAEKISEQFANQTATISEETTDGHSF